MDITTVLVIAALAALAIGVSAFMLNRAWGDFPRRAGPPDSGPSPVPPASSPAWGAAPADTDDEGDEDEWGEDEPRLPAGAPEGGLIPVTHPLVRRAVEAALERGGSSYATYFIRDGEQIFLAAYRIADPAERDRVTRLFAGLNSGDVSGLDFGEIYSVMQQLGRR